MWPTGVTDSSSHLRTARPALSPLRALALLAGAAVLALGGCGGSTATGPAPGEKIAYLMNDGSHSRIMVNGAGGGDQVYMEWAESAGRFSLSHDGKYFTAKRPPASGDDEFRRFSFSNDGRYFAASPQQTGGAAHVVVIATDGASRWSLPAGSMSPAISPGSDKVAYWQTAGAPPGAGRAAVLDLGTGSERVFYEGLATESLMWADEGTLVYKERESGSIISVDVISGAKKTLTPPGRDFSLYAPPASYPREKIALMEVAPLKNVWSLDLKTAGLYQVTNNSRWAGDKRKAAYLPAKNEILFQEPQGPEAQITSDLCIVSDDGMADFKMLTQDFFFDGLYSVSPASGRVAWQHAEEEETSIWTGGQDGGEKRQVAASKTAWLGDPNFVPVEAWLSPNPLEMAVGIAGGTSRTLTVTVANTSDATSEAVLRFYGGRDLELPDAASAETSMQRPQPGMETKLTLEPGASRSIEFQVGIRSGAAPSGDATLLVALAVQGTPPRMYWHDLAAD